MHGSGSATDPFRLAAGALAGALLRLLPALLLLAALPAAGLAHTRLESSSPAADAVLRQPPGELRLRFSTPVEPRLTGATLLREAGDTVLVAVATPEPGSGNRSFVVPLPAGLGPGQYLVEWRTAGADGHVIQGAYSFVVEGLAPPAAAPPVDPAPPPSAGPGPAPPSDDAAGSNALFLPGSPLAVLVRWLGFLGLLGMVGATAFRLAVLPAARRGGLPPEAAESVTGRLRGAALFALGLFALGLAGRLWLQAAALAGPGGSGAGGALPLVLDTGWGRAWTAQAAGAAVFLVALLLYRGREGTAGWRVAAAALAIVAAGTAWAGHAAAVERGRALALLADGLHLLGAGAWMGTLALLLGVGIPAALRAPAGGRGAGVGALVRAFSPVALLGAGTAAATGVASALFHLGAPADLWGTGYGRALLLKLALLALAAAAGFRNWRVHTPGLEGDTDARTLRRTVTVEVAVGVLVVLVTAVLVALPTR
jgi:putative copper export protein/methionine-rich copper-binding protein CopC